MFLSTYPNPFNPSTIIAFSIPISGFVNLKVYNVLGQVVATLVKKELRAGYHECQYEAANFSSGIFFAVLISNGYSEVKKMQLLK